MRTLALRLSLTVCFAMLAPRAVLAAEATVVGDATVYSAHPSLNAGGLSNLYVGGGDTTLMQFGPFLSACRHHCCADWSRDAQALRQPGQHHRPDQRASDRFAMERVIGDLRLDPSDGIVTGSLWRRCRPAICDR